MAVKEEEVNNKEWKHIRSVEGLDGEEGSGGGAAGRKRKHRKQIPKWRCKSNHKNNYINCERSEHPNQKTEICRLDNHPPKKKYPQDPIIRCLQATP